ncbi:hypothetical protein KIH39_14400 [Telmatocola sphagniphila]|jgi:hypothetical protein|uniref:Uncharacterized protein n=1 Tax=Telmatocola sphagniphila TaxID=1123043 RepID=A0A8E6B473_9BACT|nr:hypothetical protein [Telmatocola sphagniphila]QVL30050.1 hypothetical protein KIH39_14400 [Telmatocola sphagniphila]
MFFQKTHRFLGLAALLLGFSLTSMGCSGSVEYADMTGSVSIDGKAVTAGSVYIVLADNPEVTGGGVIKGDGTYTCKAPVGKIKVAIQTLAFKPGGANDSKTKSSAPSTAPGAKGGAAKGPPAGYSKEGFSKKGTTTPQAPAWASGDSDHPPVYVKIPSKYEKVETSGLTYDIHKGSNTIEITLAEK